MLKRKDFYAEMIAAYPYVGQFIGRLERDLTRSKSIIQELRAELKRRAPAPVLLQSAVAEAILRAGMGPDGPVRVNALLPGEPVHVLAGPSLPGIIWNLLDNAAKAMPAGGTITVRAQRELGAARGPAPDRVTLEIEDEGVGIEPWRLASIFEPAASTTANSYAPTHGLGLWWTKGQVESFGGTIDVTSEPGKGTRFKLVFRTAA
jgi:signal transduction histidine kinase